MQNSHDWPTTPKETRVTQMNGVEEGGQRGVVVEAGVECFCPRSYYAHYSTGSAGPSQPGDDSEGTCVPVEAVDKRVGRSVRDGGMRGLPTFLSTASVSALPADACSYLGSVLRSGIVGQNVTMGTVLGVGG